MSDSSAASMASNRARDRILGRIRSQQGRAGRTPEKDLAEVRTVIARHATGPQPPTMDDRVARFMVECDRLSTTYQRTSQDGIGQAIARYVDDGKLPRKITAWAQALAEPTVAELQALDIAIERRTAHPDDATGLTDCFCAIAETGTLVLLSSPSTPKATALLPETHICLVNVDRIVPTMEDAFALIRNEWGELPRSTFMVSGPSRTADIEQTIVIGAHGPYRVHVLLVESESTAR
jgi:L-lactate dehydrogenase complex protein LldG